MRIDNLAKRRCLFEKRDIAYVYVVFFQMTPNLFPDMKFLLV